MTVCRYAAYLLALSDAHSASGTGLGIGLADLLAQKVSLPKSRRHTQSLRV